MYSSNRINKNACAFTPMGYTTIGDDYTHKPPKNSRYQGKQFQTAPAKKPAGGVGFFGKAQHAPEPYADTAGYLKTQPLDKRKSGFGTRDASRRDEFTNHLAVEQYRERLRSEAKHISADDAGEEEAGGESKSVSPKRFLYDTVHDTTDVRARGSRHRDLDLGPLHTSSREIGDGVEEAMGKPTFGRVTVTQEFFDKGHLH